MILAHRLGRWMGSSLLILVSGLSGCGGNDGRVPLYPTSGTVLVGDKPTEGILVRLYNEANPANLDAPQPFATTDAEGKFQLGTFEEKDGAPEGRYVVVLRWPEGPPGPGIPRDRLGNAFTDLSKTPYRATIPQGGTTLEPFKIEESVIKKLPSPSPRDVDRSMPGGP